MGTAFSCGKLTASGVLESAADKIFHNEGGLSGAGTAVKENTGFAGCSENIPGILLFFIKFETHKNPFFLRRSASKEKRKTGEKTIYTPVRGNNTEKFYFFFLLFFC